MGDGGGERGGSRINLGINFPFLGQYIFSEYFAMIF
jgi:hypothetical protein